MKTMMTAALRATLVTTTILGSAAILSAPAAAQTTTASIRGQVTGPDGAPAAGATVTAVNTGTNQTQRSTADGNGAFVLNGLRPGQYRITTTATRGGCPDNDRIPAARRNPDPASRAGRANPA